eukprot:Clim_evm61s218 gene=Clim_evmTU61s218
MGWTRNTNVVNLFMFPDVEPTYDINLAGLLYIERTVSKTGNSTSASQSASQGGSNNVQRSNSKKSSSRWSVASLSKASASRSQDSDGPGQNGGGSGRNGASAKPAAEAEKLPSIPVLFVRGPSDATHCLMYLHGNGCDIGDIKMELEILSIHFKVHVFAVEYPGYGVALGTPSEETVLNSVMTVDKFIREELGVPREQMIVMGRSIGSGSACHLAGLVPHDEKPYAAVILQAPFVSIKALAKQLTPKLSWAISDRFENYKKLTHPDQPVCIIHGLLDQVIPVEHGEKLFERVACDKKKLCTPPSADHNMFDLEVDVILPVVSFLGAYVRPWNRGRKVTFKGSPYSIMKNAGNVDRKSVRTGPWEPRQELTTSNKMAIGTAAIGEAFGALFRRDSTPQMTPLPTEPSGSDDHQFPDQDEGLHR